MPSSGASQLTRSTRFQAMRMAPSICTRRCHAVPANSRCCSRGGIRSSGISSARCRPRPSPSSIVTLATMRLRPRARLLRIHARAREPPHPRLQQPPVVVDQRHRVVRIVLVGLARHPVPGVGGEQREPVVELGLVEQPRLVQQELLAAVQIERALAARRAPGRAAASTRRRLGAAILGRDFCFFAIARSGRRARGSAPGVGRRSCSPARRRACCGYRPRWSS